MKRFLHLFSFNGVATRTEWWLVGLSGYLVILVSIPLDSIVTGNSEEPGWFFFAIFIAWLWLQLATQVRRWHDRGKSGIWVLIKIIPVIGPIWALVELGFLPSVGADPYGIRNEYRD